MINAVHVLLEVYSLLHDLYCTLYVSLKAHFHLSSHLSPNHKGHWGTTDDFETSFLHFSLFSTALRDLVNSRPVHSLMLSPHLFLCLPYLLPLFTVPGKMVCKMVLDRPDEWETWPYHCSLRLFTMIRRSSSGLIACWILAWTSSLVTGLCLRCIVSCGSTSFPWLVFFFGALLWGSMVQAYRKMDVSVVYWNWEKYSCHSKLVSTLSMLLLSVLSWRVSQAWKLMLLHAIYCTLYVCFFEAHVTACYILYIVWCVFWCVFLSSCYCMLYTVRCMFYWKFALLHALHWTCYVSIGSSCYCMLYTVHCFIGSTCYCIVIICQMMVEKSLAHTLHDTLGY